MKATTNILRYFLIEFRASKYFKENKEFYESIIPNLEIAIALTEKGMYDNRAIKKEEEHWFEGDRYVEDAFFNEYKKVYEYYAEIVEFVNKHNFFRTPN